MKATILTIGDEILIGQIIDTNAAWMSEKLTELGVTITERITIADEYQPIIDAIDYCLSKSDIVLMTGGLGPTKDDITKDSIADYLGVEMQFFPAVYDRIKSIFKPRNIPLTEAHKQQCYLPSNVKVLENRLGTAPGMLFNRDGKKIISMPGVPYEMKAIMNDHVLPMISSRVEPTIILHRTLLTAGLGESSIADMIEDLVDDMDSELSIAYLPGVGQVRLRLTAKGTDEVALVKKLDAKVKDIEGRLSDLIFGYDKSNLAETIQKLCIDKGLKVSLAESCTGGYLAHLLTSIPGSSAYFEGSVVAYSYEIKENLLHVDHETLVTHGAVSLHVVEQMVEGTLKVMNTDIAVAISGIAGPGGGTEEKPVGTICMAVGSKEGIESFQILAYKDRAKNIQYASNHALNMLRKYIMKYKIS